MAQRGRVLRQAVAAPGVHVSAPNVPALCDALEAAQREVAIVTGERDVARMDAGQLRGLLRDTRTLVAALPQVHVGGIERAILGGGDGPCLSVALDAVLAILDLAGDP